MTDSGPPLPYPLPGHIVSSPPNPPVRLGLLFRLYAEIVAGTPLGLAINPCPNREARGGQDTVPSSHPEMLWIPCLVLRLTAKVFCLCRHGIPRPIRSCLARATLFRLSHRPPGMELRTRQAVRQRPEHQWPCRLARPLGHFSYRLSFHSVF